MTKKKLDALYSCVCPNCAGFKIAASGGIDFDLDHEIEKLAKEFYHGYNSKPTAKEMASKVAATLAEAVGQGYKKGLFDVDWNSPDRKQIEHLQKNVYQFSFAKCHEQLVATTQALHRDGKIVPFTEFREVAQRINNDYTNKYLPVEYNTAVASAQMGSRWVQFQEEKDSLPFLTYRTVGDANVRSSHRVLDGVTKSVDDPIWNTIFTPNGWGCRCDIEQSIDEVETASDQIIIPTDIPAMFKTNLAKTGLIFPAEHPYFEKLPETVINAADNNNPFLYDKVHSGKQGGYVYQSALHPMDVESELSIAKVLANSGDKVIMLPEINANTQWKEALRNIVLPSDVKEGRNPDAFLNGKQIVEFKTSQANTRNSIQELIREGAKQSDVVCLKLTDKMPLNDLKRAIKGRVMSTENVAEIWVVDAKDKLTKYSRSEIENFFKSKKQK